MHNDDQQLLRRYVRDGDEVAFEELVRRHLGMVVGAAQRQLGDRAAAEDAAQQVFIQLARKARRLLLHDCLEGWLHTATRFACNEYLRSNQRRARREQEAAMNLNMDAGDPVWTELSPVLDEALGALSERDRSLILRRHVRRQSGAELAAWLGVNEPAARKQTERAMSRLREQLQRRGISIAAVALAAALERGAQAQVAATVATRIAGEAVRVAHLGGGPLAWLTVPKLAGVGAAIVIVLAVLIPNAGRNEPPPAASPSPSAADIPAAPTVTDTTARPSAISDTAVPETRLFTLRIHDAETGGILPDSSVTFWILTDEHSRSRITERMIATNGMITVTWTNDCLGLLAEVRCDGYADTWIEWVREQDVLAVPPEWTLSLERAPAIGGLVTDPAGNPVPSASVLVWVFGDLELTVPGTSQPRVFHEARTLNSRRTVTATSNEQGRWAIRCIARRVQEQQMVVVVQHPDFLDDRSDMGRENALLQLRNGTFVSVLKPQQPVIVTGVVIDPEGKPLRGARVTDGTLYSDPATIDTLKRYRSTDADGSFLFEIRSTASPIHVTAQANGFAPATMTWSGQPMKIMLKPGVPLKLRTVNAAGEPIPGIRVDSHLFQHMGVRETNISTCYSLTGITDVDGRVAWDHVPDEPLLMAFKSESGDYAHLIGEVMHPSQDEQQVVLLGALRVSGTVTDARTGQPVQALRVASVDVFGSGTIPSAAPFNLENPVSGRLFENGHFELKLNPSGGPIAPSLRGPRELERHGAYLKVTANGYAAYTSRYLDLTEQSVHLDIALQPAMPTRVRVETPAGAPMAGIEVFACSPANSVRRHKGAWQVSGDYVFKTDASGCFELPVDNTLVKVVVLDANGGIASGDVDTVRREGVVRFAVDE